jgi:hypothetical protein
VLEYTLLTYPARKNQLRVHVLNRKLHVNV